MDTHWSRSSRKSDTGAVYLRIRTDDDENGDREINILSLTWEDYERNRRSPENATRMTVSSDVGNAEGRIVKLFLDSVTMTNHVTTRSRIHVILIKDGINTSRRRRIKDLRYKLKIISRITKGIEWTLFPSDAIDAHFCYWKSQESITSNWRS